MKIQPQTYKILSLNLAGYRDWLTREAAILDYIELSKPDIVLLQEVHFDPIVSPFDQAVTVNNKLSKPYDNCHSAVSRFYVGSEGEPYREGLASLSKLPIICSETLALTKHPDDKHSRIIQVITIGLPTQRLEIINLHLSNNNHSPEQLAEVYSIVTKRQQWPLIAGDFNILQLSDFRPLYEEKYTVSTDFQDYISFPEKKLTLDYLLLPKTYRFKKITAHAGFSDHSAMLYTIELIQ